MPYSTAYQTWVLPLLLRCDAERVHRATVEFAGAVGRTRGGRAALRALYQFEDDRLGTSVGGIAFLNPVGLPAGSSTRTASRPKRLLRSASARST